MIKTLGAIAIKIVRYGAFFVGAAIGIFVLELFLWQQFSPLYGCGMDCIGEAIFAMVVMTSLDILIALFLTGYLVFKMEFQEQAEIEDEDAA
jgi:hypothetical protein